jgi:hypothetical protein
VRKISGAAFKWLKDGRPFESRTKKVRLSNGSNKMAAKTRWPTILKPDTKSVREMTI